MAPFSLMSAGVSLLAKSFGVFSCTNTLARCTSVLPAIKGLSTWTSGPPKKPLNGYLRFVQQQRPAIVRQHPEDKSVDIVRKIAQQWRILSPEQKRPFEEAFVQAREQFKVELQRYQAQLSPVQTALLAEERKMRMAKRKAIRKKKELNSLGKPKRPRSAFNIYMSEHFEEARGINMPAKMKSLMEDWKNLFSHQKKAYMQLAEDDKIRYKNEIKSWEEHMVEIGREDLLRQQTLSTRRNKTTAAKKAKPKAKVAKKTASGNSKTASGNSKTASGNSKTTANKGKTVRSSKKA